VTTSQHSKQKYRGSRVFSCGEITRNSASQGLGHRRIRPKGDSVQVDEG